jgi:hypothetical protein
VIHGRTLDVEINALGRDYDRAAGVRLTEAASGVVNPVAASVMAPSLLSYIGDHVAVLAGGRHCTSRPGTARARHARFCDGYLDLLATTQTFHSILTPIATMCKT